MLTRWSAGRVAASQQGQHGEDAAVDVRIRVQAQLAKHLGAQRLDTAFADPEPSGDGRIRPTFADQGQHLPLARGEVAQGRTLVYLHQPVDNPWVHRTLAGVNAFERIDQCRWICYAFLEEIAETGRAVGQQACAYRAWRYSLSTSTAVAG